MVMLGVCAVIFIIALVCGTLKGLLEHLPIQQLGELLSDSYFWHVTKFTFLQASLSTLISVSLAFLLARALHRRQHFVGRGWLVQLTSLSLVMPVIVAVLGIVKVHGRSGWLSDLWAIFAGQSVDYLYGLNGILIAHVFFNLPLATRVLLGSMEALPAENWRLASHLGFSAGTIFRVIEWPLLRSILPSLASLIFILCFTSFAIILTLGGGPASTTLEVNVYQAIRIDFDLAQGAFLSLWQLLLLIILCFGLSNLGRDFRFPLGLLSQTQRPDLQNPWGDYALIIAASLFLLTPPLAVLVSSFSSNGWLIITQQTFLRALLYSLVLAIFAASLNVLIGLSLAWLITSVNESGRKLAARLIRLLPLLTIILPPVSFATGLFLLLRHQFNITELGFALVVLLNALFTLPFTLRIIEPGLQRCHDQYQQLWQSLGLRGWQRWRWVIWPNCRRYLGMAFGLAAALSAGDLGVIALFGSETFNTLPLLIYRLIGNYHLSQAAVVALSLCFLCVIMMMISQRIIGGDDAKA